MFSVRVVPDRLMVQWIDLLLPVTSGSTSRWVLMFLHLLGSEKLCFLTATSGGTSGLSFCVLLVLCSMEHVLWGISLSLQHIGPPECSQGHNITPDLKQSSSSGSKVTRNSTPPETLGPFKTVQGPPSSFLLRHCWSCTRTSCGAFTHLCRYSDPPCHHLL